MKRLLILAIFLVLPAAAGAQDVPPPQIRLSDRLADVRIENGRVIVPTPDGPRAMEAEEWLAELERRQRGQDRGVLYRLFDITGGLGLIWIALGFLGQLLFAGRMVVQWLASERGGRSVVPPVFWWMSLAGASILLAYFIWRKDVVGIFGQAMGWFIYARNLRLIYRAQPAPTV